MQLAKLHGLWSVLGALNEAFMAGRPRRCAALLVLGAASLGGFWQSTVLAQTTRTWTASGTGGLDGFSHPGNWSGGVAPNGVNHIANIASQPTGAGNFSLRGDMTLGTLTYSNAGDRELAWGNDDGFLIFQRSSGNALFHTSGSGQLHLTLSGVQLNSTTEFRIENAGSSITSQISGTGGLVKTGGGTLYLDRNNNQYTGLNTISGGTIIGSTIANSGSNSSFGRGNFSISNGALRYDGSTASTNRTISLGSGGGFIDVLSSGTVLTWSGVISGTGELTKVGSGTFTLSGNNTYTGGTRISNGTLRLGNNERIHDASTVSMFGGSTFNLNNFNETIGSLSGAGSVTFGSGTSNMLTTGGNNTSTSFSGVISGNGGLTKTGSGTFTLGGNNTYSGNTIISGSGSLRISHANALGSTAGYTQVLGSNSGSTGSLELAGGISFAAEPLRLRGRSTDHSHLVNVSGNNTWNGPITLQTDANAFYFESASASGLLTLSSTATISPATSTPATGGRHLHFRGAGDGVLNGSILDAGNGYNVTKSGAGTWTFGAHHTYSGRTRVEGGTLKVGTGGHLSNTATTIVGTSSGDGNLRIEGGGKITNLGDGSVIGSLIDGVEVLRGNGYVGLNAGSTGTATVTGDGSTWTNSALYVGYEGKGTLLIEDGGKVISSSHSYLGFSTTGEGSATITGEDSLWHHFFMFHIGNQGTGTLRIEEGGKMINVDESRIGINGGEGSATITGAGSHLEVVGFPSYNFQSYLYVGFSGTGMLRIEDGGKVTNSYGYVGFSFAGFSTDGEGSATITGENSLWENSKSLYIGDDGTGTLRIEEGGKVSNTTGYIGRGNNSMGEAVVTGTGSKWINSGDLILGGSALNTATTSTGTLDILDNGLVSVTGTTKPHAGGAITVDGGTLSTGSLDRTAGTFHHHDGTVRINGGTYEQAAGPLVVSGNAAHKNPKLELLDGATADASGGVEDVVIGDLADQKGELLIAGNSALVNGGDGATLGKHAGSTGKATVAGGSTWEAGSELFVGRNGKGTLHIENWSTVKNGYGYLGWNSDGDGEATVTGEGALWQNSSQVYVGNLGKAKLRIEAGGTVTNDDHGWVGYNSTGDGEVVVTGDDSLWQNSNELTIGFFGKGKLRVEDGGNVSNTTGYIGRGNNSTGEVVVTGALSTWTNTGDLILSGQSQNTASTGAGTLSVSDGGTINVGGTLKLHAGGALTGAGGTIAGNVVSAGKIAPGDSPGTMTVDGDLASLGTLEIELAGIGSNEFDVLNVFGEATLGGVLDVVLDGFTPQAGDQFEILTALGGVYGEFDTLANELPTLGGNLAWQINYGSNNVVLTVVLPGDHNFDGIVDVVDYVAWRINSADPQGYDDWRANYGLPDVAEASSNAAVPEPAGMLLLLVGVASVLIRRSPR